MGKVLLSETVDAVGVGFVVDVGVGVDGNFNVCVDVGVDARLF